MTNPNLPPALYLPTGPVSRTTDGGTGAEVELRHTPDGRVALVAFTSPDRLVECCGEHQPWIRLDTEHLPRIHRVNPYEVIVLDSELPVGLRHRARV
ncbi:SAV_915 family protein [Amycolatopsis sp. PS_44_ISF1]|uniref:SAV_915 family protein n=1 Tax=Amycolatopsis sp. PS_44_ISF1 TaxID=2974917 RepID=UPI0028DE3860|nr:SAV_915 family protein [Amycolatopsis sp. PS_44_ISF1]MDT8909517.1 SseB family protein [Amycolatopsis sp. PS_44_ISF1]